MNLIEEIKNRINIVDVARKAGMNPDRNGFIKSIYKNETKPSLKLYEKTNTFYDFSTGKSGDAINLYADSKGVSIKEAIKELALMAGLEAGRSEKTEVRSKKKIIPKRIEKRVTILKSEIEYFEERAGVYEYMMELDRRKSEIRAVADIMNERKEKQNLVYESLEKFCYGVDEEAYNYLSGKDRGLSQETIKKFRLFAIKNLKLTFEYLKDCFSDDELLISGLINKNGKLVFSYHKLIIPYLENSKIVYLRGRRIQPSKELSKYISLSNYAGNLPLKRFFNIDTLRKAKENEMLIVCEGEFDTMIMDQEGYAAVGIPGVTNIPAEQIGIIKKYDLYIAFDNDEAGANAMQKIVKLVDRPIKGIKLKHHNDLTELINERRNRENI